MSASLVGVVRGIYAIGRVDLDEGGDAEFTINRGCLSVEKTATGVYVITMEQGVGIDQGSPTDAAIVLLTPQPDNGVTAAYLMASQTPTQFANNQFEVDIIGVGGDFPSAIDVPFYFQVQDINPV
jgi:hypothetical protein